MSLDFVNLFSTGLLHQVVSAFIDLLCCRYKWGAYKPVDFNRSDSTSSTSPTASLSVMYTGTGTLIPTTSDGNGSPLQTNNFANSFSGQNLVNDNRESENSIHS